MPHAQVKEKGAAVYGCCDHGDFVNRFRLLYLVVTICLAPLASQAFVTPFGLEVNEAIERGIERLRNIQDGNGGWGGPTGLALLCFLERRAGPDWNAPAVGYIGMDPADQDRVRRGVRYCINEVEGFRNNTPRSYDTGSCLMAMSLYLVTGGPDDVGAVSGVQQAIVSAVNGLKGTQGNRGFNQGGWSYTNPDNDGDLSTTQFFPSPRDQQEHHQVSTHTTPSKSSSTYR